jgi:hypothetical protein
LNARGNNKKKLFYDVFKKIFFKTHIIKYNFVTSVEIVNSLMTNYGKSDIVKLQKKVIPL